MATFIENVQDIFPEPKMFTPDFSFIDKMLKRKEAQYDEGFSKLNNQYGLINREVTNSANATTRDQFLNSAKTNLKNLSSMDLSDPKNVQAAVNVFKPFYTNDKVIGDQALTAHWNQQESLADSLRLKDGGKEYSEDNINYVRMQRNAFKNDDPSNYASYAADKKFYTPYYDWNKEVKDAMKDFKPSHTDIQYMDGMYRKGIDNQSWNKLEISQYLNSVLSDKAKQQMKIEAAVRLGNDPKFLVNTYMQTEAADLPNITGLIDKYNAQLKTEKDPAKIQDLKQKVSYYDDQRAEITNNLKLLKSGDMSFLKKNAEPIAFKSYYNAQISKLANGYSHQDIKQTIDGNDVAMMYARFSHEWALKAYEQDRTDQRELKKENSKYGPLFPVEIKGENKTSDYASLQADLDQSGTDLSIATNNLKKHILNVSPKGTYNSIADITNTVVQNYVTKNPTAPLVSTWNNAVESHLHNQTWMDAYSKGAENYVAEQINLKFGAGKYDVLKSIQNQITLANNQKRPPGVSALSVAAMSLNIPVKTIIDLQNEATAARQHYKDTKQQFTTVNQTGFGFLESDPRYDKTKGYLTATLGVKTPLGINFFSKPEGTDIRYTIGDEALVKDDALVEKEVNRLKMQLGNEKVEYNKDTKSVVIKNISKELVNYLQIDPYAGFTPSERKQAERVSTWNVPGTNSPEAPKLYTNKQGNPMWVGFIKSVSEDGKSSVYYPQVAGQTIDDGCMDVSEALKKAKLYADNPNTLNILANQ